MHDNLDSEECKINFSILHVIGTDYLHDNYFISYHYTVCDATLKF